MKCDKVFRFGSELKRHLQSHTNTDNKQCKHGRHLDIQIILQDI